MYYGSSLFSSDPRLQFEGGQQPVNTPADLREAALDGQIPAILCDILNVSTFPPSLPGQDISASVKISGWCGDGCAETLEGSLRGAIEAMVQYRAQVYCQHWLNRNAPKYLQLRHSSLWGLQEAD